MISEELRKAIRPTSLRLKLVWAAVFANYGVYYFIVYAGTSQGSRACASINPMMTPLLIALGCTALTAGFCFKKFTFSPWRAGRFLSSLEITASDTIPGAPPGEQPLILLAQSTFRLYLMSLGMIHTCCLFGLILAVIRKNISIFIPFLIATVVITILCFPKLEAFIDESSELNLDL